MVHIRENSGRIRLRLRDAHGTFLKAVRRINFEELHGFAGNRGNKDPLLILESLCDQSAGIHFTAETDIT